MISCEIIFKSKSAHSRLNKLHTNDQTHIMARNESICHGLLFVSAVMIVVLFALFQALLFIRLQLRVSILEMIKSH